MNRPLDKLVQIPADIATPWDYHPYARDRVTPGAWAYLEGGAADELTMRRNAEALADLLLCQRLFVNVSKGHTRLELFGRQLDYPVLLGPVANLGLAHPEGDLAAATAAAAPRASRRVPHRAPAPRPRPNRSSRRRIPSWSASSPRKKRSSA